MGGPVLVQVKTSSGGSLTLNNPTGTGNTLIAAITSIAGTISGVKLGGVTDNFVQDLTEGNTADPVASIHEYFWRDTNAASGETAVTITGGGSLAMTVYEWSGLLTLSPLDVSSPNQNGNTPGDTAFDTLSTADTAQASEVWLAIVGAIAGTGGSNVLITGPGAPWTAQSQNIGSLSAHQSAYQIVSAIGKADYAGTLTPAGYYSAIVAAYKAITPVVPGLLMASFP